MCRLLVDRGANLEVKNFQERTPLFEAAIMVTKEEEGLLILDLFKNAGAEIDPVDAGWFTQLVYP